MSGLARTEKARRKTYYSVLLGACGARLFRFVACFWWLLLLSITTITKQETQTKQKLLLFNEINTSSINIITAALHQQLHSDWNSISTILYSNLIKDETIFRSFFRHLDSSYMVGFSYDTSFFSTEYYDWGICPFLVVRWKCALQYSGHCSETK